MPDHSAPTKLNDPDHVASRIRGGSLRALARGISWLEAGDPRGPALLATLRRARSAEPEQAGSLTQLVGVTGAPGSGKSTLVDQLIASYRAEGLQVGVIAIDPSSPFTGGALLGDRIRMTRWHDDDGVYVRSMASRGRLGGLAAAAVRVAALLEAAGYPRIVIETVGVGQSEVDVAAVADTTVLVLAPGAGDGVQAVKAGVMEVADVVVVNKADLPGAELLRNDVLSAIALAEPEPGAWVPPVVLLSASDGSGVGGLCEALAAHRSWLVGRADSPGSQLSGRALGRARAELAAALRSAADRSLAGAGSELLGRVARGEVTAERAALELLARSDADDAVASEP